MEPRKKEPKELPKILEPLMPDGESKAECVMCRFVLVFAVVILLLVAVFTFFFKLGKDSQPLKALPPDQVGPLSKEEYHQRALDLGQSLYGTATNTNQRHLRRVNN